MTLQVVGAGLGRTGTNSLKLALEQLLGGSCYHMMEVFGHPEHIDVWHDAVRGTSPDWDALFAGYVAGVDWPVAAFWEELAATYPEATVVLSVRDPESWWASAANTIFAISDQQEPGLASPDDPRRRQLAMAIDLLDRCFTPDWRDKGGAIAAYEAHNARVRASVAPERLVEWRAGDGWGPLCAALGVAVPDADFPHVNTTADFRAMAGLDGADSARGG